MKKKVLMSLVLLIVIGTSAVFAQRVGETVQLGGQTYRVESNSNGRVVLQLVPSLEGSWRLQPSGEIFLSISGNTAVFTDFARNLSIPVWQDAKNKGYIKVGDQYLRNLRSTGNLTWSGQFLSVLGNSNRTVATGTTWNNSNRNVATGTRWTNTTLTMNSNGTFTMSDGATFISAGIQ